MTRSSRGNCKTSKLTPSKLNTKSTTTETAPSNNHTSPNQLSNSSEKDLFDKQQKDIDYLVKRVRYLESKISEPEGCLFVTQRVNSLLEAKIDCQEQYSRRPCLVINGMSEPADDENDLDKVAETLARESDISKGIIIKNIDKTHPIRKTEKKGLQRRIVKFTSDSFKEEVFKKHIKILKKSLKTKRKKNNQLK